MFPVCAHQSRSPSPPSLSLLCCVTLNSNFLLFYVYRLISLMGLDEPCAPDFHWLQTGFSSKCGQYLVPLLKTATVLQSSLFLPDTRDIIFFSSERVSAKDEKRRRAMKADFMALWAQLPVNPQTREQKGGCGGSNERNSLINSAIRTQTPCNTVSEATLMQLQVSPSRKCHCSHSHVQSSQAVESPHRTKWDM